MSLGGTWLFDACQGLWHLLFGDDRPNRRERKLKAQQIARVEEIKAERGHS